MFGLPSIIPPACGQQGVAQTRRPLQPTPEASGASNSPLLQQLRQFRWAVEAWGGDPRVSFQLFDCRNIAIGNKYCLPFLLSCFLPCCCL